MLFFFSLPISANIYSCYKNRANWHDPKENSKLSEDGWKVFQFFKFPLAVVA